MHGVIGCRVLDKLVNGSRLFLFYGEAGTGKTSILLNIARNASLTGLKVIYISTEGYMYSSRVAPYIEDYNNVMFVDVDDFDKQVTLTLTLPYIKGPKIIIIDSINALYRLHAYEEGSIERLGLILAILKKMCINGRYVFASAQVRAAEEEPVASGMPILSYWFDVIVHLIKSEGRRLARVIKPRGVIEEPIEFEIHDRGVEWHGC